MEIAIAGLALLVVSSNLFWALVVHKLINKLMSRTYWEYQQATTIPKSAEAELADALKNVKVRQPSHGSNELDTLDEMIAKVMPMG